ncbi:unnamed protein product [Caenorhabditis auriculariae]|uniref:ZZ-type domain-containing protein n=1 Tax=Caenorhabditis auriculariae TaxID=2777116 RepID=A0A8S1GUN0_9PELO|nr:unnamed protein product [Caenorhabditis auriculariae]
MEGTDLAVKLACGTSFRRFRFHFDENVNNYEELLKLVRKTMGRENATIAWRDEDGDTVEITSEEELREAVFNAVAEEKKPSCLRLFDPSEAFPKKEKLSKAGGNSPYKHNHVATCDGCERTVIGHRFRCVICPDFDLCESCERKGAHEEHAMLRIVGPRTRIPWGTRLRKKPYNYAQPEVSLGEALHDYLRPDPAASNSYPAPNAPKTIQDKMKHFQELFGKASELAWNAFIPFEGKQPKKDEELKKDEQEQKKNKEEEAKKEFVKKLAADPIWTNGMQEVSMFGKEKRRREEELIKNFCRIDMTPPRCSHRRAPQLQPGVFGAPCAIPFSKPHFLADYHESAKETQDPVEAKIESFKKTADAYKKLSEKEKCAASVLSSIPTAWANSGEFKPENFNVVNFEYPPFPETEYPENRLTDHQAQYESLLRSHQEQLKETLALNEELKKIQEALQLKKVSVEPSAEIKARLEALMEVQKKADIKRDLRKPVNQDELKAEAEPQTKAQMEAKAGAKAEAEAQSEEKAEAVTQSVGEIEAQIRGEIKETLKRIEERWPQGTPILEESRSSSFEHLNHSSDNGVVPEGVYNTNFVQNPESYYSQLQGSLVQMLSAMGFDSDRSAAAVAAFDGNMAKCIDHLISEDQ